MTKSELLQEIGLSNNTTVYEFIETEKLFYVIANNEKEGEFCNFTTGEYAKWKNKNEWFTPNYARDTDVYDEIKNHKNMILELE